MTLEQILAQYTAEGRLYKPMPQEKVRCFACAHRCVISERKSGICRMRVNREGKLYVPFGYVAGLQADPIEKKPFFHVLPGARALSFGMLGCNFSCSFCQNWMTSRTLRDPDAVALPTPVSADEIVERAVKSDCRIVTSTYNEPLITSEWAVEIFKVAKRKGLITSYVSNGNATPEVLDFLQPWLDLFKVDLKSFDEGHYRELGGALGNVCRTIEDLWKRGFWVEVVTLLIPRFNDSDEELKRLTEFLASVSCDIPWHCTAFHKDYRMTGRDNTPVSTLLRAVEIGKAAGLRYVYAGNLPGRVGEWENTYCHKCRTLLVERCGFQILVNKLESTNGLCAKCGTRIPGFWHVPQDKA